MSWLLLVGRKGGGGGGGGGGGRGGGGGGRGGGGGSRGWGGEEEYELEVTFRRRFSPETRKSTIVGLTVLSSLKDSTFYSH